MEKKAGKERDLSIAYGDWNGKMLEGLKTVHERGLGYDTTCCRLFLPAGRGGRVGSGRRENSYGQTEERALHGLEN